MMQTHIYFGDGKGKTTAALGVALRAGGQGWRVLVVQFLKDSRESSGELAAFALPGMQERWTLIRGRLPCPAIRPPRAGEKEKLKASVEKLLRKAIREVRSGRYEAVVLDEVLAAWKLGLLKVGQVREAMKETEAAGAALLILTGRWAPKSLVASADLVTEMRKVRHPFDGGEKARRGIDF